nr:glycosyltransferase [Deinococcus marmoris]
MLRIAAPYWISRGLTLEVLSTGDEIGIFGPKLEEAKYVVHHLPYYRGLRYFLTFYRFIKSREYDVIHVHIGRGTVILAFAARLAGISRIAFTIHSHFPTQGIMRWAFFIERKLHKVLGIRDISISTAVAELERKYYWNSTKLIFNWYDSELFRPPSREDRDKARCELKIHDDQIVFLSIGNCGNTNLKNHSVIIEALASLEDRSHIVYIHVGEEKLGYPERNLANSLGISEIIRFEGYQIDSLKYLWAADVYLMPSSREGFGIAALEALSTGLPAVLADTPGLSDLKAYVGDGVTWEEPTVPGFANQINYWRLFPSSIRFQMGQTNTHRISREFNIIIGAKQYIDLYKSL